MPIELKMPALSPTMEQGTLARWLVKAGDRVQPGDLLAEIETDKATMEYEAIDEGVIARLIVPEGSDGVAVGTVIALLAEEAEASIAQATAGPSAAPIRASDTEVLLVPPPEAPAIPSTPIATGRLASSPKIVRSDLNATPLAHRLAEQLGIDLAILSGTGTRGRIVKADVVAPQPMVERSRQIGARALEPAPTPIATDIPHERLKLSSMRRTIARRLSESKQTVPHFYLSVDCVLDRLLDLRSRLNADLAAGGVKLSVNDLLIKALAVALGEVGDANVQFAEESLLKFTRVDIAMAVAVEGGLVTPVIRDAGAKSVSAIAREAKALAARARDGKLTPEEYQGGTASISNLGMYGIRQMVPVINPPQAVILGIGAGEPRPHVTGGALAVATIVTLTGSFDHRAIDGVVGAQLMAAIKTRIEQPLSLLA